MKNLTPFLLLITLFLLASCAQESMDDFDDDNYFAIMVGTITFTYDTVIVGEFVPSGSPDELYPTVGGNPGGDLTYSIYVNNDLVKQYDTSMKSTVVLDKADSIRIKGHADSEVYVYIMKSYETDDPYLTDVVCVYKGALPSGEFDVSVEANDLYSVLSKVVR